ncbi:MAG: sulfite exporter TauE/SafE family protein [Candidatus Levybacteria bacterium]|nr:sulfite exporter TauE/SafE family protein [Candidatus Levybacteria bacterium]
MNLWVVFITGLTVGGLTCLAVQGGLLASVIAAKEEDEIKKGVNRKNTVLPTLAFLLAKLIAYAVLGFILGAFGGAIGISQEVQIIMQLLAGIYMVAVAFDLLNVHPIFRYAVIQPPKFLTRRVRNQSRSKDLFAPAFLGAMTIFIPCGTTLAMEALAISSGNAFAGAAILSVFVLGTMPLFFGIGIITSFLGDNFREKFLRIAAITVLYLGFSSINGALVAGGSPISIQSVTEDVLIAFGGNNSKKENIAITSNQQILVTSSGYSPNYIKVKKGTPVTIQLRSQDAYSCASAFRIPSLGISKNLQPNEIQTITFAPEKTGQIPFSCSMGMYRGVIEVL